MYLSSADPCDSELDGKRHTQRKKRTRQNSGQDEIIPIEVQGRLLLAMIMVGYGRVYMFVLEFIKLKHAVSIEWTDFYRCFGV